MTVTACTLAALLIFEAASAPAKDACELTDDRCKAALYERRAVTAAAADHRAQYLFNAHNLYVRLFDKTGNPRDLCSARRAIEASLAIDDQPDTLRSESETLRTQLLARAKQQRARCASKTKRRVAPADAPLVSRASTPEPADSATADQSRSDSAAAHPAAPALDSSAPVTPPHAPRSLLADSDTATSERPDDPVLMPVTPLRASPGRFLVSDPATAHRGNPKQPATDPLPVRRIHPKHPASELRPGRGLVIAGGVTLGVGVALTAAAGSTGRRTTEKWQEIRALSEQVDGFATTEQAARDDVLRHDLQALKMQTVALAITAGGTVIVAAVLASIGGRRMARVASRTALLPAPGGLVFHMRF